MLAATPLAWLWESAQVQQLLSSDSQANVGATKGPADVPVVWDTEVIIKMIKDTIYKTNINSLNSIK